MTMFRKELLEIMRTKKFIILIVVFLFVAFASPALAKITPQLLKNLPAESGITINLPEPTWKDSIDQFIKNLSQVAILVLVFIFAGVIAEEKNKKTLEIVLTKPVSRTSFVSSKFLAAFTATSIVYIVSAIIFYAYTLVIFGNFSFVNFSLLAILALVYLLFTVATAILCSTFTSNSVVAAFIAFGIQIIIVSILGLIDQIKKYLPGNIFTNYKDVFSEIKPESYLPSALVTIAIIILCMIISISIFRKQEIER